ncbi:hypothetical protein L1987_07059 [Smallanthus sonchifolius]|uniref:Uncharacterized protein n=1 Tax=Smallanthus sonchifolius TaxID=185202 RepID=A0ACB9JZU8_9ASTR|nr:hypothetical protein L1987_07059 [Smallanthus sonchifolius]
MASSENSTTNIAKDAIVIAEVVHSTAKFDVNQLTKQTPNASSYGDVSSTSNNLVNSRLEFIGVEHQEGITSNVYRSPNGTKYWTHDVCIEDKPVLGMIFDKWEDVVTMYESYAKKAGFSTHLGAMKKLNDVITHRYMMCTRAEYQWIEKAIPVAVPGNSSFIVYEFVESHNHGLVDKHNMDLTRKRRKLSFSDQQFIHKLSLNRIGPAVAHKLQSSLKGGHHNVHDTLEARTVNLQNFFFEFTVISGELRSLFWADDVSKLNYIEFGDVIAFDATYNTNKYNMIFVPFTGVDHHKRCVTFGAGLLYNETVESYKWLLECFLKAHKKQPKLVLTDQDASMKQAVAIVFHESIHRLCMWHIMKKLPSKISSDLLDNTNLRSSIHKLVWNLFITSSMFEENWKLLIDEYDLDDHAWLKDMYAIREQWVPCYFRDIPLCCLMKTTSRCESSNALFKINSNGANTFVQFLLCFDTAIDGQWYNQRKLEFESNTTTPLLLTDLPIERQASEIYTWNIFLEVQKEIFKGKNRCLIANTVEVDGNKVYTVGHTNRRFEVVNEFKVTLDLHDKSVSCSCVGITRIGYLCRHVFFVFRFNQIQRILNQYLPTRWRKNVLPKSVYSISNRYSIDTSEDSILRNEILELNHIFEEYPNEPDYNKKISVIGDLIGQSQPGNILYTAPQGIRNKGCGMSRRLIGPGEKAVEKSKKKNPRLCRTCFKWVTDHDSRNCLEKKKKYDAAVTVVVVAAAAADPATDPGAADPGAADPC